MKEKNLEFKKLCYTKPSEEIDKINGLTNIEQFKEYILEIMNNRKNELIEMTPISNFEIFDYLNNGYMITIINAPELLWICREGNKIIGKKQKIVSIGECNSEISDHIHVTSKYTLETENFEVYSIGEDELKNLMCNHNKWGVCRIR